MFVMKVRTFLSLVMSALFFLITLSGIPFATGDLINSHVLQDHSPIVINNNADFTVANGVVAGAGTKVNPYLIENWTISANVTNAITISNTTSYFIIRNCKIAHDHYFPNEGIFLNHVRNGKIANCRFDTITNAIHMEDVSNILIENTIFANHQLSADLGIFGRDVNGLTIHNNTIAFFMNSILIGSNVTNIIIDHNDIQSSLYSVNLGDCVNCYVHNNTLYEGTQNLLTLTQVNNSIIENNTLRDLPTGHGIEFVYCHNITIRNNKISNVTSTGIYIGGD